VSGRQPGECIVVEALGLADALASATHRPRRERLDLAFCKDSFP